LCESLTNDKEAPILTTLKPVLLEISNRGEKYHDLIDYQRAVKLATEYLDNAEVDAKGTRRLSNSNYRTCVPPLRLMLIFTGYSLRDAEAKLRKRHVELQKRVVKAKELLAPSSTQEYKSGLFIWQIPKGRLCVL
jgi:hypothetical protein